jgi:hypothetical protein
MIRTDSSDGKSLKALRKEEAQRKEVELRAQCEEKAKQLWPDVDFAALSNKHKGLFFLPILDEDENGIEKLAVLKPIDRHILSYASTKIEDEGLYTFLGAVLESCWLMGDEEIKTDDQYFIPACGKINKIIEGKKAALVKR